MLATIIVDSPLDNFDPGAPTSDGVITLREAIIAANTDAAAGDAPAGSGTDIIAFDTVGVFSTQQTVLIAFGEYEITEALTIDGPGQSLLTLDAQQNSRIFNISAPTGDFSISGLTMTNGLSTGDNASAADTTYSGGAIRAVTTGQLSVEESTISGSSAQGDFVRGGGIFSDGPLSVVGSELIGNDVQDPDITTLVVFGGGLSANDLVTVTDSTITGNSGFFGGGGIHGTGPIEVTDSTISGNIEGGILAQDTLTLTRSTVSNNTHSAGGAGIQGNEVSLIDSTVSDNTVQGSFSSAYGGGIFAGNVTLTRSTVSGNTATITSSGYHQISAYGGGIWGEQVSLTQSTVSGNTTSAYNLLFEDGYAYGGGIAAHGITLSQSTVAYNSAYSYTSQHVRQGMWARGGPVVITGSIVAANGFLLSDLDPGSGSLDVNNSLIGFNRLSGLTESHTPDANGNIIGGPSLGPIFPLLNALRDNGGLTETHALTAFSPAIDAGDPTIAFSPTEFDQRGDPFVRVFDADGDGSPRIDMGAYERDTLAVMTVDTVVDELDGDYSAGDLSLREALLLANLSIVSDKEIYFDSTVFSTPQTIALTLGQLEIVSSFGASSPTIHGPGENLLTIDAQQNSRIFNVAASTNDLTIHGLTLTGGQTTSAGPAGVGGALRFRGSGNLTINESTITGSSSTGTDAHGGAIYSLGPVDLSDSIVSDNSSAGHGGGIYGSATLNISSSTISGNSASLAAGGIFSQGGNLVLANSTVTGNDAVGNGGGLALQNVPLTTVTNSTISGNSAFAGGGISFYAGELQVTNSTISNNSVGLLGGGVFNESGDLTVTSSTISGNQADQDGGGLFVNDAYAPATAILRHSTIAGNQADADATGGGAGGGIRATGASTSVTLDHSIVADNTDDGTGNDILGTVNADYSLFENTLGATIVGADNITGMDANLGPLADNGGPTETHALLPGSPAIDMGDMNAMAGVGNVPLYDQRGMAFSRVVGGRIDIGAYELATTPSADFDSNTIINGLDFLFWQRGFGTLAPNATPVDGDADNDQDVDEIDFGFWEDQFGETVSPLAAVSSPSRASLIDAAIAQEQMEWEQQDHQVPVVEKQLVPEESFDRSDRSDILHPQATHFSFRAAKIADLVERDEAVVEELREDIVDTLLARIFG